MKEARGDIHTGYRQVIPYDEALENTVFTLANDMLKDICQVSALEPLPTLRLGFRV